MQRQTDSVSLAEVADFIQARHGQWLTLDASKAVLAAARTLPPGEALAFVDRVAALIRLQTAPGLAVNDEAVADAITAALLESGA